MSSIAVQNTSLKTLKELNRTNGKYGEKVTVVGRWYSMLKIDIKIEIFTKQFSDGIMLMLLMLMISSFALINYKINFSSKRVHCFLLVNIIIWQRGSSGFAADQNKIQILFLHLLLKLKELLSEETENQVLKFFFIFFCVGSYNNTKGQQHRNSSARKGNFLWRWAFLKFLTDRSFTICIQHVYLGIFHDERLTLCNCEQCFIRLAYAFLLNRP